jgi:hypothetical protein
MRTLGFLTISKVFEISNKSWKVYTTLEETLGFQTISKVFRISRKSSDYK